MENAEYFKAKTEANSVNKQIIEEKRNQKLQVIESSDEPASKVKIVLKMKWQYLFSSALIGVMYFFICS